MELSGKIKNFPYVVIQTERSQERVSIYRLVKSQGNSLTMKMKTGKIIGFEEFNDILAARRGASDYMWASRRWIPKAVYETSFPKSWRDIQAITLNSHRIFEVVNEMSSDREIADVHNEVQKIIQEIGYRRVEPVLRWLAFFTAKILKKIYTSVYVNEATFFQAKSQMGSNPVLLLPTHRSYLDFVLISYLSFHYDMDIPRIAAGMDFHSMSLVSRIIRDACSFFMRRSFTNDKLYTAVFSQYVQTLATHDDAPIEFFIEGTRSRTEKSLVPKYGFLTMTMMPLLAGQVPDVTLLPVNLSYDRVSEEVLLVYELLGVPKPKESTKGLFKGLRFLDSNYGNVFIQFGRPFSAKEFFADKIDRSIHNFGPIELQNPTAKELDQIRLLAQAVVRRQQNLTVLTCFNLMATVMNYHMTEFQTPLSVDDLVRKVAWLVPIFRSLGAKVAVESVTASSVSEQLHLHKNFVKVTLDEKVSLLRIHSASGEIDRRRMKGHLLSDRTMDIAVPLLLIQYYSNPCAHFIVNLAFIMLIVECVNNDMSRETLTSHFRFLRSVYMHEFVLYPETEEQDFESSFALARLEKAITQTGSTVCLGENKNLRQFCISFCRTYIPSYLVVIDVLMKGYEPVISSKSIQIAYQEAVESSILLESHIHPASLSLDLVANALQAFIRMGAVRKIISENGLGYEVCREELQKIQDHLRIFSVFYKAIRVSEHLSNFLPGKL